MALQHTFGELRSQLAKRIIGQEKLVDRLLIALLADGHLLVEGAPGLAKTTAIKALADHLEGDFHRIQFTPDLLPSDVTGSEIYRAETGQFEFQHGPIFHNLVLADEINRAPAKVQSALLEAMGERQVSVGMRTFPLDRLFMVMATQNPIEQEGTYPLPEAQLDRFLMHVVIDYPSAVAEKEILHLARNDYRRGQVAAEVRLTADQVFEARHAVSDIYMSEPVEQYLLALVLATRDPASLDPELARWTAFGASPRGTIALDRCARAMAWLEGRDYVSPDDVRNIAFDVLRHRILLTFEAEAEGLTADAIIQRLIDRVPVTA
ncbi:MULTISPECIES: AAA family ATPase [Marinobacter]|jgi:MoxR-like ATPase|uniref:ATPase AAA n=1 Tax=Marinobacter salarius TaxID=1420917 RepID=W5YZ70_9GAMM|nr:MULTISPECIES: MoxR family ATPase [Marinobacter]AHI31533.1 ATPase AAA [Marinobacter salarius]ARM83660.1 replication factor C small subunit [Marinobacter salarius]AZR42499.1 protein MoxR [Marinobacter salarius]MAB51265.1 MoxR family ATPase [Marinobacter sp.]MBJ7299770.1 MoxR family ATPase [Marinobacter salarius]|tara:strand:- start:4123 stop:5085 length:963 start_codon:yes stop_codon:yes gene_type:complete